MSYNDINLVIKICRDNFAYLYTRDEVLFKLLKKSFIRKDREYNNYYRMYEEHRKIKYTLVDNDTVIKVKAGLIPFLCKSLDKTRYTYSIQDERLNVNEYPIRIVNKLSEEVTLRDYQEDAVKEAFKHPFSCLQLPTSSGKTEIAASIIRSFLNVYFTSAVLYAVPTLQLQKQSKERFEEYGIKTNIALPIQTGKVNILTFATINSINKNKDKFDYQQRNKIGAIIWDEAHHLSAKGLSKTIHYFKNLRLNIGLSATVSEDTQNVKKIYLKQLTTKEMDVFGCTGELVYDIATQVAINTGFITPIEIRVLQHYPKSKLDTDEIDWQIVKNVILKDRERAQLVSEYVYHIMKNANLNTVTLLIPEVEWSKLYMKELAILFKDVNVRVFELYGGNRIFEYDKNTGDRIELKKEEKEDAYGAIRNPNIRTVFSATTFFFEGADIPCIQAVVNCYGGKDSKRVRQQCGRAMRLFKNKDVAYIHEIKDNNNPILESQFRHRLEIYQKVYNAKVIYSSYKKGDIYIDR